MERAYTSRTKLAIKCGTAETLKTLKEQLFVRHKKERPEA
jgi:hypothetical protein